ncbi:hypothetical protein FRC17_001692 [Serendipita sp. 399]|nr:hypothetical protein FRC17_001692 [Serendipita sp. 399]
MRSTRISAAAASRRNQSVDAQSDFDEEDEDEEEDDEALDRYQPPHQQQQRTAAAQTGTRAPASYAPPSAVAALSRSIERASPEMKAKASILHHTTTTSPRFSPYPIPSSTSPQSRARRVHHQSRSSLDQYAATLYSARNQSPPTQTQPQTQVASYHRSSAPIDIYHRHRTPVMQSTMMTPGGYRRHHHHRSRLSVETDSDYGMPSPGYPRQSVPAPSEASSSTSDDELEEEDEDEEMIMEPGEHEGYGAQHDPRRRPRTHDDRQGDPYRHHHHSHHHSHSHSARDYSPRTPSQMPHSLPSPRVMHAPSSSVPTSAGGLGLPPISTLAVGGGAFSPKGKPLSLSPLRNSMVLPLPEPPISLPAVALPPLSSTTLSPPTRDSLWRWNYHDRVSSIRHTLSDKLYHNDDRATTTTTRTGHHHDDGNGSFRRRGDDSEEEEAVSDGGFSPISSPFFRPLRLEGTGANNSGNNQNGGFLERIGGFFTSGGSTAAAGKKQLFAAAGVGSGGDEMALGTQYTA